MVFLVFILISALPSCTALVTTRLTRLVLLNVYQRYLQRSRFVELQTPNKYSKIVPLKLRVQNQQLSSPKPSRNFRSCALALIAPVVKPHQQLRSRPRASIPSLLGVDFARIFCNQKCFKAFNTTFITVAAMLQATEGSLDRMNVH